MAPKKKSTQIDVERALRDELKIGPRWKDVLLALYNKKLFVSSEWTWVDIKDNLSTKKLGLSKKELIRALSYLEENGLIEHSGAPLFVELTSKGFDVAVKIEEQRETRLYRLGSLMFSGLLALTLVTTLIYQMDLVDPRLLLIAYIITAVLLWIAVLKLSQRKPLREMIRGK